MASRIHDSVLQTLALVQREANDPQRVRSLARRQERELRSWLYGSGVSAATLSGALADAAADVEDAHGIRVELTASGDLPLDDALSQLVLAAREAMANAGKHSGVDEVAAYAEVEPDAVTVWVRDRGVGFDRAAVAADRRGIAESIEARMARAGGTATVVSSRGRGDGSGADAAEERLVIRVVIVDDHELFRAGRAREPRRRDRGGRRGRHRRRRRRARARARPGRRPARRAPPGRRRRGRHRRRRAGASGRQVPRAVGLRCSGRRHPRDPRRRARVRHEDDLRATTSPTPFSGSRPAMPSSRRDSRASCSTRSVRACASATTPSSRR